MCTDRRVAIVEFVLWVLAVSAAVVAVTLPLGVAIGGDLIAAKFGLFLVGLSLFGLGSIAIQPSGPDLEGSVYDAEGVEDGGSNGLGGVIGPGPNGQHSTVADGSADGGRGRELAFEARLQTVGPLADRHLPYEQRIGRRYKVFATGIVVLAVSFVMEVAGVGV